MISAATIASVAASLAASPRRIAKQFSLAMAQGRHNAKLRYHRGLVTFALPAGHSCPHAKQCKAKVVLTGEGKAKVEDGPDTVFRCYAATEEALFPSVRIARRRNFDLLLDTARGLDGRMLVLALASIIADSIPAGTRIVRIHTSGDFFSQAYFDAWLAVAVARPCILFYAYTKSLSFWVNRLDSVPANFVLTASRGGGQDALIARHGLREAVVVFSEAQAAALGLEIDDDDTHAMKAGPSFALLIHGTQPAGSFAGKAIAALRAAGEYGYGDKADLRRAERQALPMAD